MRRFDFVTETAIFTPFSFDSIVDDGFNFLDFLHPTTDTVTDLIQIQRNPFRTSTRRVGLGEQHLLKLCDRVSDLEHAFERLVTEEKGKKKGDERVSPEKDSSRYKWTAETKALKKSYKYTAEIKGKGKDKSQRTYTVKVSNGGDSSSESEREEKTNKNKKCQKVNNGKSVGSNARIVEIEEPSDHAGVVLRQVFAKRLDKKRGKKKELSPEVAAALIQRSFRTYLIRRSQSLRALRELAIAKNKLKEIRALFSNFSYRRRLSRDAEEHQRFSEKIIVLLLTVDAIEGADRMVRAAKKSMVDELEALLDVVDPQPPGKSGSIRRRRFDMPDGVMNKEVAAGVAQVVRMLEEE